MSEVQPKPKLGQGSLALRLRGLGGLGLRGLDRAWGSKRGVEGLRFFSAQLSRFLHPIEGDRRSSGSVRANHKGRDIDCKGWSMSGIATRSWSRD